MLTLGSGSACDICLEGFGTGHKVASAIICGHAFCSECIDKLRSAPPTTNHPDPNYKPCPLCRHTFDTRTYIRLHVDHDSNARLAIHAGPTASEEDAHIVQSLFERMINIANEGSSEEDSRRCITETRSFLQRHKDPKQFIELQTCFRMLVYTTGIRVTNRQLQAQKAELETQKKDLEASLSQVKEEKLQVERKAKYERDLALSIEKSLQDHAKLTRDGYEAMIMHYNRIATDLNTICEHLQHSCRDDSTHHHQSTTQELASRITQRLSSYHDEHVRRDEHVLTEPGDFMVSPLAAYSALPTRPFALPEESEVEMLPPKPNFNSQLSTCCDPDLPANRDCAVPPQPRQSRAAVSDRDVAESVHTDRSALIPITQTEREAADFHSTNDDGRDQQSPIHRNREHNHDHSPYNYDQSALSLECTSGSIPKPTSRGSISTDETTPPAGTTPVATASSPQMRPSPLHISGSTSRSQRCGSIPKEKTPTMATTPLAPTSESPPTRIFRNHVLQDLLEDIIPITIPISGSSSQISVPSSSTQSPVVPRHDSLRPDEKKGCGLGYYTLPQPSPSLLAKRRELHRQESLRKSHARDTQNEEIFIPPLLPGPSRPTYQSHDHAHMSVPTYDPSNVPISSASSAAKAKARERAAKAEREKSGDSIRKKAEREGWRKAKRAEAGYPEYERFTSSYPGERPSSKSKWPSDSCDCSQQGTSSSRHTSSYDPPPPYTSASQRASNSGSKSSRCAEKYAIDSHGNKYIPVHILSSVTPA